MYGTTETQAELDQAHATCQRLLDRKAAFLYERKRVPMALNSQIANVQARIRMLEFRREGYRPTR